MLSKLGSAIVRFFTSYALVCVVLVLLLVLTFLGTLEQTRSGIFDVQKKYFESVFLVYRVADVVPVPLPGGALLMGILAVNLICGGIVRIRKTRSRTGILLGHAGILMLLSGALVKFAFSMDGHMTLFEGEQAAYFESYFDWEVTMRDATANGEVREYVIPVAAHDLGDADRSLTYGSSALPFELTLAELSRNAQPAPWAPFAPAAQGGGVAPAGGGSVVDGFYLQRLAPSKEAEQDAAGMLVRVRDKKSGTMQQGLLWGMQRQPLTMEIDGQLWALDLHHKRFDLPFAIRLDHFTHETHPGTQIASTFSSDVTRFESGATQATHISMNEPLRHEGYTLYQASWGPEGARPGDPVFSTFAVAKNPADHWPLYSCIVIASGLLVHFSSKLGRHLRSQQRRTA
jgi:hypothetical protein